MLTPAPHKRWTAAEVLRMVDLGVLAEDASYELLDGDLIRVTAKGPLHRLIATALNDRLVRTLPPGFHVQKEECVTGDASSLPEPDVAIVRGRLRDYRQRLPGGKDLVLAIEVSASTFADDQSKLAFYARAGVPVVWIVDVVRRRVEVHIDNRGDPYATSFERVDGEAVEVPILGESWTVASILDGGRKRTDARYW